MMNFLLLRSHQQSFNRSQGKTVVRSDADPVPSISQEETKLVKCGLQGTGMDDKGVKFG